MSYQEERLQEIADAIREVKGTTEKIPATNFASEIVGLSVVKPSGIITIKENGSHNVANYEWAEVSVEADLNERVIIGKWVSNDGGNLEFKPNGVVTEGENERTYTIEGSTIFIYYKELEVAFPLTYDYATDTMSLIFEEMPDEPFVFTRVPTTLITKEITENGTYKASDEGADGYSEVVVNVGGIKPFADATPEQIQQIGNEISAKGMTSAEVEEIYGWKIGDIKDITLTTGEVIQMRIIGFNHDNLTGGGKAGITLEMVNCLNTEYKMNNTRTNAGGWKDTTLRNTTLPTIKATLPQEWQKVIVKVDKKSANGGNTNFTAIETTSDDLFLLSEIELMSAYVAQASVNEGTRYEYWASKTTADRKKEKDWWLRSSFFNDTYNYCRISASMGNPVGYEAQYASAISFAFCVGSSPAPVVAGLPIEVTTDTDMTNALIEDNLGQVYKFTGTSDTYETDAIYIVSEV